MVKSFNETVVYFTQDSTSINSKISSKSSLKIQIIPTEDKTEINSIKISYFNGISQINEEIDDANIFSALTCSLNGIGDTLVEKITSYMNNLEEDEICVIIKEYSKYINDGVLFDALVAGIGSYLALLVLIENGAFVGQFPFEFSVPCSVCSGNTINGNMFKYMSLPLISLRKLSQGVLLQLVIFVESFINIWSPLFLEGPSISTMNESKVCLEIISGFSQHILSQKTENSYMSENYEQFFRKCENLLQESSNKIMQLTNKVNELSEKVKELKLISSKETIPQPNVVPKNIVQWQRK
jgi:hypothetical protein